MIAAALLAFMLGAGPLVPPPAPAIVAIPDEPGAVMLPEAPTYQAVAADVDEDGVREVVRLVGAAQDAIDVEVWRFSGDAWEQFGAAFNAVPGRPTETQGSMIYSGSPARLIVRRIGGVERATLVRQPRFEEPGLHVACCLLLDDVAMVDGAPGLVAVAERGGSADAVLAIDMDGDRTDELLITTGRPPLGNTAFPTDARVLRWAGDAFAEPVLTDLPVGSGASPFVLGDSDEVAGDEAAFIGAQSRLHRISLRAGDTLVSEDGGAGMRDAFAVPLDGGRGVALLDGFGGLSVHSWPRGGAFVGSTSSPMVGHRDLLGVVTIGGRPELLVRGEGADTLMRRSLPTLSANAGSVTRSPSAGTLAAGPVPGYVGPLFGGGLDGAPAIIYAGHLLPSDDLPRAGFAGAGAALTANLAGVVPIGLVGPERGWVALWHRPLAAPMPDPSGGRLDAPVAQPGSGVSVAPVDLLRRPELDDGILDPPISNAPKVRPELIVGASGFVATVSAPPGSRAYLDTEADTLATMIVPASGTLELEIRPSSGSDLGPNPRYRAEVVVVTPAGHGYLAAWNVRVLDRPPEIEVGTSTPFGRAAVQISGRTAAGADVLVAGVVVPVGVDGRFRTEVDLPPWPTGVEVVATDALGNESRLVVAGVGWFDYRALPWVVIAIVLVGAAGVASYLRVPRTAPEPVSADDDATLEEMEPD